MILIRQIKIKIFTVNAEKIDKTHYMKCILIEGQISAMNNSFVFFLLLIYQIQTLKCESATLVTLSGDITVEDMGLRYIIFPFFFFKKKKLSFFGNVFEDNGVAVLGFKNLEVYNSTAEIETLVFKNTISMRRIKGIQLNLGWRIK